MTIEKEVVDTNYLTKQKGEEVYGPKVKDEETDLNSSQRVLSPNRIPTSDPVMNYLYFGGIVR